MKKFSLFLCFFVSFLKVNAQLCGTETPQNYQTYENQYPSLTSTVSQNNCLYINVVFRIVRNDDGTNASFNPADIPQALSVLNQFYAPHGISFVQVGTYDYINNTILNNNINYSATFPANIPNAINIYTVKYISPNVGGQAFNPFNHLKILGSQMFNASLAHEIGHILNLKHTFECSSGANASSCAENPDGSNSSSAGDKVVDTPADYELGTIPYFPVSSYHPDLTNIMSYWNANGYVLDHFTPGQGQRMRDAILNAPYLQSVRSNQCAAIDGPNYICGSGTNVFSIAAFGSPLTLNWTVTGNLQIVGSATGSSITLQSTNPDNTGSATITVTINGSIVKTKTITIGPPLNNNNHVIGFYDWVSTNYGNMGLVAPTNPSITSFRWEIVEDPDFPINCAQPYKPRFIGSLPNDPYTYSSNTNQAVINWGSCTGSYMIVCYALNDCGETMYDYRYTDVGNPKNNPCYKNTVHTVVAPNPVRDKQINLVVNKTIQSTPCNWRSLYEPQYFNRKLDQINNSVSVYDFDGNLIFNKVYDTDEFTIREINIKSGNNYIVNLFTNEGGFTQQVIVVE